MRLFVHLSCTVKPVWRADLLIERTASYHRVGVKICWLSGQPLITGCFQRVHEPAMKGICHVMVLFLVYCGGCTGGGGGGRCTHPNLGRDSRYEGKIGTQKKLIGKCCEKRGRKDKNPTNISDQKVKNPKKISSNF